MCEGNYLDKKKKKKREREKKKKPIVVLKALGIGSHKLCTKRERINRHS